MLPVQDYDPEWTLYVVEDLKNFFFHIGFDRAVAQLSEASNVIEQEIQESARDARISTPKSRGPIISRH